MTPPKYRKPDVDYRLAVSGRRCGRCTMWRARAATIGSCTAVEGPIWALAVCDLFRRRSGPARRE